MRPPEISTGASLEDPACVSEEGAEVEAQAAQDATTVEEEATEIGQECAEAEWRDEPGQHLSRPCID